MLTRFPPILRMLSLWLTLLAFPGLAAAAAQPCALHGHAAAAAAPHASMQMPTPMAATDAHQAVHQTEHQAAPPPACHDDGAGDHRHGEHAHGRCSACAACCAGVAPPPALVPAPGGAGAAHVAVPFRPGHLPSVDPFPLERPPRFAFA